MSAYEIKVSVTPLCTSCGAELHVGCTESRPMSHPLERDNPLERTQRRVFVAPCEKCFVFKPNVTELVEADRQMDFTPLDHLPDDHPCNITVRAGDLRRRNAALAKFGGAA